MPRVHIFSGIKDQRRGLEGPAAIAAVLRDKTHGYSEAQLSAKDASDLALFVSKGEGNLGKYLSADNKSTGDAGKGEVYFNTICAGCHGLDGKKLKDAPPLEFCGQNGAEMMHKLLEPGRPVRHARTARTTRPRSSRIWQPTRTKLPAK